MSTLRVFNKGETSVSSVFNTNCPTNAKLTTQSTGTGRFFTVIHSDDSQNATFSEIKASTGLLTEYSNQANTEGFKIRCYDSADDVGIQLNGLDANDYYFVLIHSDNENMHHFARITEFLTEDVDGDAFEFTPKLGNQVNKNVKFMLFKGTNMNTAIAVSCGLKEGLRDNLVCARPLFYFLNGLDKSGELNHNTKYYAAVGYTSSGASITPNTLTTTFLTEQDYSNKIVDYSLYSLNVTLTDLNREGDIAATPVAQETYVLPSADYTDYEDVFYNARRETSDNATVTTLRGPTRYVHYDYSPDYCNLMQGVFETEIEDSVESRSGFAESTAIDNKRIYPKKISEDEPYRIRHMVHTGTIDEWFELQAEVSNYISAFRRYIFTSDYPINDLIATNDVVKLNGRLLIVTSTSAGSIDVSNYSRLETESEFTNTFTNFSLLTGSLYRRAYSQSKGTLLTTFPIIESRDSKIFIRFMSNNFGFIYANVSDSNKVQQTLTLSFSGDSYHGEMLKYVSGKYIIFIERFDGVVESFESFKENGQTMATVKGRNNFRKLLSPIVNTNKLFSRDIIYSSRSFYNKLTDTTKTVDTTNSIVGNSKTFDVSSSGFSFVSGDIVFVKFANNSIAYVGIVDSYTYPTVTLEDYPKSLVEGASSVGLYVARDKNYILNKALSSNANLSQTVSSLNGAAGKGIYFEGGTKLQSNGSDGESLIGSSSDDNANALGYPIFEPDEILSDLEFQTKLKGTSTSAETFDTVNTLIDFEVLGIKNEETYSIIELAPYLPLTLGRVDYQYSNTTDSSFSNRGSVSATTNSKYFTCSTTTALIYNEPLYVDGVFIGKFVYQVTNSSNVSVVYIDRKATFSSGQLQVLEDKQATYAEKEHPIYSMSLVNGAHLHGGKAISLLHPFTIDSATNNHLTTFNPVTFFSGSSYEENYNVKFGSPYYRIMNLEFGRVEKYSSTIADWSDDYDLDYYSENPSSIKYYGEAYRLNPGFTSSVVATTGVGKTGTSTYNYQWLFETKGILPASGSRFFDEIFLEQNGTQDIIFKSDMNGVYSPYRTKDLLEQFDTKVSRMFLFANTDLEPYSGTRKDNIFGRDLTNYSLILKKKERLTEYTSNSDINASKTTSLSNIDNDYVSLPILENTTIPDDIQFGLMRLTEVVYDWHFNQIDPENLPSTKRIMPKTPLLVHDFVDSGDDISSISGNTITLTATTTGTISNGDFVCDDEGNFIGTVSGTPSGTTVTLILDAKKQPGKSTYYNGRIWVVQNTQYTTLTGHGPKNSILWDEPIHMLKSFVYQDGWGGASSQFNQAYGSTLYGLIGNYKATVYPIDLGIYLDGTYSIPSKVLDFYQILSNSSAYDIYSFDYQLLPILLEKFDVDDGTGNITKGMVLPPIKKIEQDILTGTKKLNIISIGYNYSLGKNPGLFAYTDKGYNANSEVELDGTYLGFKPRIRIDTSLSSQTETEITNKVGNRSFWKYELEVSRWSGGFDYSNYILQFINSLDGCYLVSEKAQYTLEEWSGAGQETPAYKALDNVSLNDSIPETIAYVVSHEVKTNDTTLKHVIITDKQLTDDYFRVMQPNHTCMYEFTPEIKLNEMSSKYTKVNGEEKTYSNIKGFNVASSGQDRYISSSTSTFTASQQLYNSGGAEAAMSMYVAVDLNNKSSSESHIVYRNAANLDDLLPDSSNIIYMSDGETNKKTELTISEHFVNSSTTTKKLQFGEKTKLLGIVSITQPFEMIVPKDISGDYSRAMIGAGVSVANEATNIINDLLEDNGIQFEIPDIAYSHYLAPNFQGIDLFSAINYILTKKDYSLVEDSGVFKIREGTDSLLYSGVLISDYGEYQIFDFRKEKSTFDRYNEIVVYGRSHKAVRKDLRSIQKSGRKTLESFQRELNSQQDVDQRATELFLLHNRLNEKIVVEIGHQGISQIQPGDIIEVEIRRENIPRSQYKVIQVTHKLTGNLVLQLGRYSKRLEDQFSELLLNAQRVNSAIRETAFNENVVNYDFLENLKVKPLRLLIRKRSSSGGTLGFGITLGFGSTFTGLGTITETELEDVEY